MTAKIKMMCCVFIGSAALLLATNVQAQVSDDDKQFLAKAAQSDVNEIKLSQLAEEKASNPAVKAFAQKMVTEHNKLSASMKPFADSWGLTAPTDLDDDHEQEYAKLNGLSGADFDKEYMDQMVSDHAKALDAFTTEAKDTKDTKFKAACPKGKDCCCCSQKHGVRPEAAGRLFSTMVIGFSTANRSSEAT